MSSTLHSSSRPAGAKRKPRQPFTADHSPTHHSLLDLKPRVGEAADESGVIGGPIRRPAADRFAQGRPANQTEMIALPDMNGLAISGRRHRHHAVIGTFR